MPSVRQGGQPAVEIARRLEVTTETLRLWVRQAQIDNGVRPGSTSADQRRITELEREVRELRRANEILESSPAFFGAELDGRRTR